MAEVFVLRDEVLIRAPLHRCFLLSTSVEIVRRELRMKPVEGRTFGLVQAGETVLWRGFKFGLPQFHQSVIEEFRPPLFFRDRMLAGRFRSFEHDHAFDKLNGSLVRMHDEIRFTMRWGPFGVVLGRSLIAPHIRKLLRRRFALLKRISEAEEWRKFVPSEDSVAS
jgi:ligand-binding SRPBCC domain-containing protein